MEKLKERNMKLHLKSGSQLSFKTVLAMSSDYFLENDVRIITNQSQDELFFSDEILKNGTLIYEECIERPKRTLTP